nr:hypothetical protein [Tanacetum cinerariifolium]
MKEIDWKKVKFIDEIILEDIYNTFYKDEAELAKDDKGNEKVDDTGKGKIDDKGKGKMDDLVDALEKGNSKLMVSGKGTKKASVDLVDALDLQNRIKKLFDDFNMLVKAKKTKEAKEAKVIEVSSDEEDFSDGGETHKIKSSNCFHFHNIKINIPIASAFNAQAASTAPRGLTIQSQTSIANAMQFDCNLHNAV